MDLDSPAPAGAPVRYQRGAWTLAGHVRNRLRQVPTMTRDALRTSLRAAGLLTWGTAGAARLSGVLHDMQRAGEVTLTRETVTACDLRQRKPRTRPPEAPKVRKARRASIRQERARERIAAASSAEACQ